VSKITRLKLWSGTLREERCAVILTPTKVLNQMKKTCATFLFKQPKANKPDVVVYTKVNKKVLIIDPACAFDTRTEEKV